MMMNAECVQMGARIQMIGILHLNTVNGIVHMTSLGNTHRKYMNEMRRIDNLEAE